LKFVNDNFECKIIPITKYTDWRRVDANISEGITTDFGGTVFLRGGESQKVELEYSFYNFGDEALGHIKENLDSLEYYIKFTDNLGKNYLMKINDIRVEREVRRK